MYPENVQKEHSKLIPKKIIQFKRAKDIDCTNDKPMKRCYHKPLRKQNPDKAPVHLSQEPKQKTAEVLAKIQSDGNPCGNW